MTLGGTTYQLYGLTICSSLRLPCPPGRRGRRPQVDFRPASPGALERIRLASRARKPADDWFRWRRLPDQSIYLHWKNLFEFLISRDGRTVQYQPLARATHESFTTYLLGQVLSFSLLALGAEPLHGTAVVVNGKAIGFLGNPGVGKSTLGAAFLAAGYPVLSDDLLVLERRDGGFDLHPGVPRIKLYPSVSLPVLGIGGVERLNADTSKQVIPLGRGQAWKHSVPLAALYVLVSPESASRRIEIRPFSRRESLLEALRHSFNTIVTDQSRLARQFDFASDLVERIPIKRLIYPRRLARLPAVREMVLADPP